jgi:hypothetical protein
MGDFSDNGENKVLGALTEKPFIKLHTGAPGEEGKNNAAGEAKRKKVTMAAAAGGKRASSTDVEWPEVSTAETITHVSAWDAEEGGNCEWVAPLEAGKAVSIGDTFKIASTKLSIAVD